MRLHRLEDVREARAALRQRVPVLADVVLAQLCAGEERAKGGGQRGGVELADRDLDRVAAAELGLEVLRAAEALQPPRRDDAHP